jgi:hypothetical protein
MTDFERFLDLVVRDDSLRDALLAESDVEAFFKLLIDLAAQRGLFVTDEQVRIAFQGAKRSWLERRAQ